MIPPSFKRCSRSLLRERARSSGESDLEETFLERDLDLEGERATVVVELELALERDLVFERGFVTDWPWDWDGV